MEKVYVGSHKTKEGKHGAYLMQSFSVDQLETMKQFANDKGWVTLFTSKRREVGKYGDTHTCTIAMPRSNVDANNSQPLPEPVKEANIAPSGLDQQEIPF